MLGSTQTSGDAPQTAPGRWAPGLAAGLVIILAAEVLLYIDVAARGGIVVPASPLPAPGDALEHAARWAATYMTPVCWIGYLLVFDALLTLHGGSGSPARRSPRRFVACVVLSVPIWLAFEAVNAVSLEAWAYHGLSDNPFVRNATFAIAFATICPAMFVTAELLQQQGLRKLRGPALRVGSGGEAALVLLGLACLAFALIAQDPVGSFGVWLAFTLLLDPLNRRLGAPSILGDWRRGHWGRTVALIAAALLCGFFWEFWNHWAAGKWTYNLPFLGPLEDVRYFEMPVIGLAGYLPFGIECWVMYQSALLACRKLGLRFGQPSSTAIV
jgi:hypothetical protein